MVTHYQQNRNKPNDGFNTSSTVLNQVNQLALILLRKIKILT
jgi:hypothetical protein